MAWVLLGLAGLLEVVWAIALKRSGGLSAGSPATWVFAVAALASFWLLAQALRTLPVGTGYAVWTGIGAIGAALVGIVWLGESADPARIAALTLIAGGIVWLALVSA
ncbi:MAG: multidrug efflux SMR transporter [Miltoncostaeaceae bacterium]